VHDAFAQFDGVLSRDRALLPKEFRLAGKKLGISENELSALFKVLDTDQSGQVTLTEFLHGLVEDVSPESLLWELRCRLDSHGVHANNVDAAFDLIRRQELKCRTHRKTMEDMKAENLRFGEMRRSKRLSRSDWLRLATVLGLTYVEAERLFVIIDDDASGSLDLHEMFRALQRVAPNVTLERFATKVVMRHGTFHDAFKAFRCSSSRNFGRKQFLEMAAALDVNDSNASQLWEAWDVDRRNATGRADKAQQAFVSQMEDWAPDTVLDRLREQMLERFGSLIQGYHGLKAHGLTKKGILSTSSLDNALRAAGFCHCDAGALLSSVARFNPQTACEVEERGVTLKDLMSAMQHDRSVRRSIGEGMGACFQQLYALKANIRMGDREVDAEGGEATWQATTNLLKACAGSLPEDQAQGNAKVSTVSTQRAPASLTPRAPATPRMPLKKLDTVTEGVSGFVAKMKKEEMQDCGARVSRSGYPIRVPVLPAALAA
jgi:Ca2+-binding EF-hand superfamily protein